jgi:hypothetical protein
VSCAHSQSVNTLAGDNDCTDLTPTRYVPWLWDGDEAALLCEGIAEAFLARLLPSLVVCKSSSFVVLWTRTSAVLEGSARPLWMSSGVQCSTAGVRREGMRCTAAVALTVEKEAEGRWRGEARRGECASEKVVRVTVLEVGEPEGL